ncbi:MAG: chromosome partitioning protein ParB [Rhodospirillaceae bacterium]|nr:chromosome partitioning protein ParB [Rhodospirillaceae bacterium]
MNSPKTGGNKLGRGLSALLGDNSREFSINDNKSGKNTPQKGLSTVPVEFLIPSSLQPRQIFGQEEIESLAASIKKNGILQPILVRSSNTSDEFFEIIAGERRWRGAQVAGLHEVPVIVRDFSDEEVLQVALIENIQRANLNPIEEALGYRRLINEFKHTQDSLSDVVGKSRSHIANILRLLSLPESIQNNLKMRDISAGHARTLIGVPNAEDIVKEIINKKLNVRQTEILVKKFKSHVGGKKIDISQKDSDTLALEKSLSDALGLNVLIGFNGKGGKLTINYESLDQLDDIISRLTR